MRMTASQLKGRLKNISRKNHADARLLLRIYMMDRLLERVASSLYKDNFIIKGGILITSKIGVAHRSTMDIDTTIRNLNLSEKDIRQILETVCTIDLEDGVIFRITHLDRIMDEMDYPGIRVSLEADLEPLSVPLKIDISTDDAITPRAVEYNYKFFLEDRSIQLWSYNLETLLSEKCRPYCSGAF